MAKILVADDNSNIQKMVGLALKDQGIEVIAVGNGEAAVRKISEVRPDLVLADVFMPVRNGYEVCEYVKADRSLSHIPVILLVGAFDPLDEQEAQRVGADGVLKKPFVPPEPLISMVKSALARGAETPAVAPAPAPAAALRSAPAISAPLAPEELPEIFSLQPASVTIPEGSEPLAFGNLLGATGTPAANAEAEESDDIGFVVPRNPQLEEARAWGTAPAVESPAKETNEDKPPAPEHTWRNTAIEEPDEEILPSGSQGWQKEKYPGTSAGLHIESTPENTEPVHAKTEAVEKSHALPEVPAPEWASALTEKAADEALTSPWKRPAVRSAPEAAKSSAPSNPWAAEVKQASRLTTSWDTASAEPTAAESEMEAEPEEPVAQHDSYFSAAPGQEASVAPAEPPAAAEEQAAQSSSYGSEAPKGAAPFTAPDEPAPEAVSSAPEAAMAAPSAELQFAAAAPAWEAVREAAASAPDMNAVVDMVLQKMSPDVIQALSRELLKPMIEAIVRGELDKKK